MLLWGGADAAFGFGTIGDGASYDPVANTWQPLATAGAPAARRSAAVAWTGTRFIVWGGFSGSSLDTGAMYEPTRGRWTAMLTTSSAFTLSAPVWTGSRLIAYGGGTFTSVGGIFDPVANAWTPLATAGAPSARGNSTSVWTGTQMIVWGGHGAGSSAAFGDGAILR